MPWISNPLLPTLQGLSYLLLSLGNFSHRYLPPYSQSRHPTLSEWEIFPQNLYSFFLHHSNALSQISHPSTLQFSTFTAQEPQLMTRQRHLLSFSCFLCLERGSWWCRRWCGARYTFTHPGNEYFPLCCFNLSLFRHWAGESVLPFCIHWCDWICACAHDLHIPAQCWPPHYASLVLQRFGNNPISQCRVLSNLK